MVSFRDARIKAGLTVAQVMTSLSVSDAAVYQWETGETTPNAKRLPEIARLYGCTIDDLLKRSGEGGREYRKGKQEHNVRAVMDTQDP